MYTISYFGRTTQGQGNLREALELAGIDVGNNQPYVSGGQIDINSTPPSGSTVTFRPAASGKAA